MSDDDVDEQREAIRERKRERLRRELAEDGVDDESSGDGAGNPDEPVHVEGSDHFEDLVDAHGLLLVDYYADWCGPCRMMEPAVESVAADTGAVVAKVDVDAHERLAARANVRGVPTLVLYRDGEVAERLVGMQNEQSLRSVIRRYA